MGRGAWSPTPPGHAVNHDITAPAGAESASTRAPAICPAADGLAPRMGGDASLKERTAERACRPSEVGPRGSTPAAVWPVNDPNAWESAADVRGRRPNGAAAEGANALLHMALSAHPCGGTTSLSGSSTGAG